MRALAVFQSPFESPEMNKQAAIKIKNWRFNQESRVSQIFHLESLTTSAKLLQS
jgi:hypothetical protein